MKSSISPTDENVAEEHSFESVTSMEAEMDGDKPDSDKKEDFEATVIDFLDREIKASKTTGAATAPDELDTLVKNLLNDVITTSDNASVSAEAGEEDVDALLSGIFRQSEDERQGRPRDPVVPLETKSLEARTTAAEQNSQSVKTESISGSGS